MGLKERDQSIYANILSDGTIRVKSEESDPKSVRRDYELKDGTKGTKFERVYQELSGKILSAQFYDGDFGRSLILQFNDGGEEDIALSMNTTSNFAEDFMKKMPNIDFTKEVTVKPYNFTDDRNKLRKGVTVIQDNKKIGNYFSDGEKALHGFPEVEVDKKYDKDDWKIYFIKTRKFLMEFVETNIFPLINSLTPSDVKDNFFDGTEVVKQDEIVINGNPFDEEQKTV